MKVTFNYEVGKLYDTVFYIVTRLFEDIMIERAFLKYSDVTNLPHDTRFYKELKDKCPEIPNDLTPLCYCDSKHRAFLLSYIIRELNTENGTMGGLKSLLSNSEKSKQAFIDTYFSDFSKNDREKLYETDDCKTILSMIKNADIETSYQADFLCLLLGFENYIALLIETIEAIYPHISDLHSKNDDIIDNITNQLISSEVSAKEMLYSYFAIMIEKPTIYMFSIVNPYVARYEPVSNNLSFMLGEKFLISLSDDSIKYKHTELWSLGRVVSSKARKKAFQMFFKYESLNTGDIAYAVGLSRFAAYAYMDELLTEKAIVCVNNPDNTILRYALNTEYLMKMSESYANQAKEYIDSRMKGSLMSYERPKSSKKEHHEPQD